MAHSLIRGSKVLDGFRASSSVSSFSRLSQPIRQVGWFTWSLMAVLVSIAFVSQLQTGCFTPGWPNLNLNPNLTREDVIFFCVFTSRYLRLFVDCFGYFRYRPALAPAKPKYATKDVSVILPTVDPSNRHFFASVRHVLENRPHSLLISTVGTRLRQQIEAMVAPLRAQFPDTNIAVIAAPRANKRVQVLAALGHVSTTFLVTLDDTVLWGPRMLSAILHAFEEDERIALVGTAKWVKRPDLAGRSTWERFWSMEGNLYLTRHNWQVAASSAVDGGAFVISGRTMGLRSAVVQDAEFARAFTNDYVHFGPWRFGPLNADDDNFITNWILLRGWRLRFQATPDATLEVARLGEWPSFMHKATRWARSTWRANPRLLAHARIWQDYPWSCYSVWLSGLFNLAAVWDPLLLWTFSATRWCTTATMLALAAAIMASKMIKVAAYFCRHPEDLFMFPLHVFFVYVHSFVRLYALLTFWDCAWGSRDLKAVEDEAEAKNEVEVQVQVDDPSSA